MSRLPVNRIHQMMTDDSEGLWITLRTITLEQDLNFSGVVADVSVSDISKP